MTDGPRLQYWQLKPREIEARVRAILEAEGALCTSTSACRDWVRDFIQQRVRRWKPGDELRLKDRARIGRAFEKLRAKHGLAERHRVPLQDRAPVSEEPSED